jgi:hypothetical protein
MFHYTSNNPSLLASVTLVDTTQIGSFLSVNLPKVAGQEGAGESISYCAKIFANVQK